MRTDLATQLSIDEKSVVILKIEDKTWNDGCLGLGGPAESCLQALVDGFRVELLSNGKSYFYRTDKTGGGRELNLVQQSKQTAHIGDALFVYNRSLLQCSIATIN